MPLTHLPADAASDEICAVLEREGSAVIGLGSDSAAATSGRANALAIESLAGGIIPNGETR